MRSWIKRFLPVLLCLLLLAQGALAYSTLEKGDSGSDVLRMQRALNALGYSLKADGDFGTATRNAVREFQKDHSLTVDGKAGNETLTRLYTLYDQLQSMGIPTPTAAPETPPASAPGTAVVYCEDGGKLNLRAGSGTGFKVLLQIPTGSVVALYERGSKWCCVGFDGETGYVMTSFLRFDGASVPTLPPVSGAGTAIVTCDDGGKLNLRKTANSGAKVLGRIPNGTVLTVQKVSSKWCKTSYNGDTGYVMSAFLDFSYTPSETLAPLPTQTQPPVTEPTAAPIVTPPSGMRAAHVSTADGGSLNLRKTASSGASVLDRIPNSTALNVEVISSKWCKTSYNGKTGYVMSKYLVFTDTSTPAPAPTLAPPPAAQPDPGASLTAEVYCENGGKLNLRAGAGTGYKVLTQIPNKTVLPVLVRGTKWSQVLYNGETGYVNNDYLIFAITPPPAEEPPPVEPPVVDPNPNPGNPPVDPDINSLPYGEYRYATVKTVNGSLNVRKGAGKDFSSIDSLPDGKQVVVKTIEGEWCAIYYGEKKGYVMRQYLLIAEPTGSDQAGASYDTSILTRNLRDGYTGADVELVQARLVELKYLSAASGSYDSSTINAVKSFQRLHSLTVDGVAGRNTFDLLFSSGAFPYTPTVETYTSYVVDYRDESSAARTQAVTRAQRALSALNYYAPVTGKFDEDLHDAVVDFQLRNGVTASGILDEATQYRLYSGTAHDVGWQPRASLEVGAGILPFTPSGIVLKHWFNEVNGLLSGTKAVTVYDPDTGLSWQLSVLSRNNHLDVQPTTLRDTLIQRKSFTTTSWDIHTVYVLLPDGSWCMATMHNRAHGVNTIINNGFGGQNCVHFLRDMAEAQRNDPSYGVRNQEALRESWKKLTGNTVAD